MQALRIRLISAIVLGIALLAPFFFTDWLYLLPFTALAFLLGREFIDIQIKGYPALRILIALLCGSTFLLMYTGIQTNTSDLFSWLIPLFCILMNSLWISNLYSSKISALIGPSYVFKAFVYLALNLSCMHILLFNNGSFSPKWFILTMVAVWLSDILAYGAGNLFGKTPFFPSVSPKKSWEGFIGALIGTAVLLGIFALIKNWEVTIIILISFAVTVSSAMGDLVESKMKRTIGIKNSGNIMPGHGGVLDRFDGFLFAIPTSAFILQVLKYFQY